MKLKSSTSILLLLIFTILFVSCECVPDIVTPKVVEPTDFAKVMFINAIPDIDSVDICSVDKIISRNLLYDSTFVEYKKIASGLTSIRIQNFKDSAIHFNSMFELIKDAHYTFFAYGTKSRVNGLLINDSIENPVPTNAYVRFVHLSQDAPEVVFAFDSYQINQLVKYKSYTKFMPIPTGIFTLVINDYSNGSEITKVENYNFKPGKYYNLLLKGYYIQPNPRQLKCDIIEFTY
ncbi:MAG: hypothetical protein A2X61_08755 [Ignavibacteria bacterium GWB2_35_12]|nr:MAG: hypothetical protein A2X63_08100 [Ignavibacteria bacterium GWA2_35_8]OGU40711.1 MAG: hypothetical protein A2X61_08755 [Ignavibacteria bacterium GWB2_35_12]OGU97286.1 MAG: hypothetical protein A2220_07500 [Ignavibacteria bacterium RIFOXYA2_FULL_35_10]OGV22383.1 MAG: hypothetical protein A2475_15860 [Ignavibacteria bacterium RIFOXYC2_FULL_35_21]